MNNPKVSIIMGVYNCQDTVAQAVESILSQTYDNWELILCDDCSTDRTLEIISSYRERYPHKIVVLRNEQNQRLAKSLNHCLRHVTGEYIARMDGDDLSAENRLEEQVRFLEQHPEYDLVGSAMLPFDEQGDKNIRRLAPEPDRYCLRKNTPFAHATIMARKHVYQTLGGYSVSKEITRCEDVDLWFRFFEAGFSGYNLDLPLYRVREGEDAFKRRTVGHALNTVRVCLKGYKKLHYPIRYYPFLLKPVVCALIPNRILQAYHK